MRSRRYTQNRFAGSAGVVAREMNKRHAHRYNVATRQKQQGDRIARLWQVAWIEWRASTDWQVLFEAAIPVALRIGAPLRNTANGHARAMRSANEGDVADAKTLPETDGTARLSPSRKVQPTAIGPVQSCSTAKKEIEQNCETIDVAE
jgi:hypothetical protein